MLKPIAFLAAALLAAPAIAQMPADQPARFVFGGDAFSAGQQSSIDEAVPGDAFAVGYEVRLTAATVGSAHLAGFNVTASAPVEGDLYAGGFSVGVTAPVGGSVTAAGNSVSLAASSSVGHNARLAAANVTIDAPVSGSVLVSAEQLTLNGPVGGELRFFGQRLVFGPNARVDGALTIHAPNPIAVPTSVAPAERVTYERLVAPDYAGEAGKTAGSVVNSVWPAVWGSIAWWVVLFVIGMLIVALMPARVEAWRNASATRPLRTFGWGILVFAMLLGLTPLFAMTLIGLLLVPVTLIVAAIGAVAGYLMGAYFIGLAVARRVIPIDTTGKRIVVLALSLVAAVLLGSLPLIGWLVSLTITAFGLGSFGRGRWVRRPDSIAPPVPGGPLPTGPII